MASMRYKICEYSMKLENWMISVIRRSVVSKWVPNPQIINVYEPIKIILVFRCLFEGNNAFISTMFLSCSILQWRYNHSWWYFCWGRNCGYVVQHIFSHAPWLYNNPKGTSLPFESILRGDPMNIVHVTWSMVYGKSKMLSRCILSTSRFRGYQIREL